MDAPMKQAVAIIIGALLIAGALVFQAYQHRYEVAGGGPLFVLLDSRDGQLSACTLGRISVDEATRDSLTKRLSEGGFSQTEINEYFAQREGRVLCSPSTKPWD